MGDIHGKTEKLEKEISEVFGSLELMVH